MSSMQKKLLKNKLPPRVPRTFGPSLAPFGNKSRDYTPLSWKDYFASYKDVEIENGLFRVYSTSEPENQDCPRVFTLHGGGYSALSWSLFSAELTSLVNCQVVSLDIRGHGETQAKEPEVMDADSLVSDVREVILKLYGDNVPPIILVGHSMGGAIAVRVASQPELEPYIVGLVVIDVVEGTAMESLASMQSFLRSRPTHFKSIEHAIEWCVRSGQVRNTESARVSMPSQIVNCETNKLSSSEIETYTPSEDSTPASMSFGRDAIQEESESQVEMEVTAAVDVPKTYVGPSIQKYKWRIDLSRTEPYWRSWFEGLSKLFLTVKAPKMLLLASIDGLDKELTVGQMQGKFQMRVLTRCGHAVHEDRPEEVATALASFMLRQQLTTPTEQGAQMQLQSMPGC